MNALTLSLLLLLVITCSFTGCDKDWPTNSSTHYCNCNPTGGYRSNIVNPYEQGDTAVRIYLTSHNNDTLYENNYIESIIIDASSYYKYLGRLNRSLSRVVSYTTKKQPDSTLYTIEYVNMNDLIDVNSGRRISDSIAQFSVHPYVSNGEIFKCYVSRKSYQKIIAPCLPYNSTNSTFSPRITVKSWGMTDLRALGAMYNNAVRKMGDTTVNYDFF